MLVAVCSTARRAAIVVVLALMAWASSSFSQVFAQDAPPVPTRIALWAQRGPAATPGIELSGSDNSVRGAMHSNGSLKIAGSKNAFSAAVTYVSSQQVSGSNNTFAVPTARVAARLLPYTIDVLSYAPGGSVQQALGAAYFDKSPVCASQGKWKVSGSQLPLAAGVYYVPCEVQISGSNITSRLTLVSTGKVQISGSQVVLTPYHRGLQIATSSNANDAVKLSGSRQEIGGLVWAPNGTFEPSGADGRFGCGIVAGAIKLSGSKNQIGHGLCGVAPVARDSAVTTLEDAALAITLDASDADSDLLQYQMVSAPTHGTLSGTAPQLTYTPVANYHGADELTFRVIDSYGESATAKVRITVTPVNDAPVAQSQTLSTDEDVALPLTLGGTDPEGGALSYTIVEAPTQGTLSGTPPNLTYTPTANYFGVDEIEFRVSDGELQSAVARAQVTVTAVNDLPVAIDLSAETDQGVAVQVTLRGSDIDADDLSFHVMSTPTHGQLEGSPPTLRYVPASSFSGTDTFRFFARDSQADSAPATVTVTVRPGSAPTCDSPAQDADGDGLLDSACAESFSPPDPAAVAPPVDPTVATGMHDAYSFIVDGPTPIQRGVPAGTIDAQRVAVLRGRVLDGDGHSLSQVLVRIAEHPEFGYTYSRADGGYELLVNGGSTLTVDFQKEGYLRAHRQAQAVPWQGFGLVEDVMLVALDAIVTPVAFGPTAPSSVALGSPVIDADGTRQPFIVVPSGTTASIELHDGTLVSMSELNLRATEYTVGDRGPERMPAPLPLTSAYTYAVELSADEAIASNARTVRFSQPLSYFFENFLEFPVGTTVPVGYYDYASQSWRASKNGRVIKVVGIEQGLAQLDIDGSGGVTDAPALQALGISQDDLRALASQYAIGQTLWWSPIAHLTPWDCNFPYAPPEDATEPEVNEEPSDTREDEPEKECASVIGCQNSSLGEVISITGTPFSLHYQSDRSAGYVAAQKAVFRIGDVPANVKRIDVTWQIAGRKVTQSYPPTSGQALEYRWDGKDFAGRKLVGAQTISAKIGHVYDAVYVEPARLAEAFGKWSQTGVALTGDRARQEVTLFSGGQTELRAPRDTVHNAQIGGWTINAHHSYDLSAGRLHLGSGSSRSATSIGSAGVLSIGAYVNKNSVVEGDPVSQTYFSGLHDTILLPDGSALVSERSKHRIWRAREGGAVELFAGDGSSCSTNCPVLPTAARSMPIGAPQAMAVDKRGCVFVYAGASQEIVRICDGIAERLWSGRDRGSNGVQALVVGDDGALYVGFQGAIYQVDSNASALGPEFTSRRLVAGVADSNGEPIREYGGNDGPATSAHIFVQRDGLAIGPDGLLYLAERPGVIRRIDADGTIRRIAGRPSPRCDQYPEAFCFGLTGLGGPATEAVIPVEGMVEVGRNGTIYFWGQGQMLAIDPSGKLIEITKRQPNNEYGNCVHFPSHPHCKQALPSNAYVVQQAKSVAVSPSGRLLIGGDGVVHKLSPILPQGAVAPIVVADSAGAAHHFDSTGRHLRTTDANVGATWFSFEYDLSGRLQAITDRHNNRTVIERSAAGIATAVVAPFGQRTELVVDAAGDLRVVRNPLGHEHRMSYTPTGLLTSFQRPGAAPSTLEYSEDGLLEWDRSPEGGSWALARSALPEGGWRVDMTTAEGRTQRFDTQRLTTGERITTRTHRDGALTSLIRHPNGVDESWLPDGSTLQVQKHPEPRFGMAAPMADITHTLPSGKRRVSTTVRTVTLTDASNPFSLASLLDRKTTNGRVQEVRFDAATRRYTLRTPQGRVSTVDVNAAMQPVRVETPGLAPTTYHYDGRGRVDQVQVGDGADARATSLAYDANGFVEGIDDPLRRLTTLDNDALGQTHTQTLPDLRQIGLRFDARGNVRGVTPPGRTEHAFDVDNIDQVRSYTPPTLADAPVVATDYAYNRDKQLDRITRPDGAVIDPRYHASSGRLDAITSPEGEYRYSFLPGGRLDTLLAPGGHGLDYGYDGPLLTSVASTGAAPGTVAYTYDANFWLDTVSAGGALVDYGYDNDGLLTSARIGATTLTLARKPENGLLTGTTVGQVTDNLGYNGFGEPTSYSASRGTATQFSAGYTRDALGRIETRSESVLGQAAVDQYSYDLAGRLDTVHRGDALVSDYRFDANGNREEHRIGAASTLRGSARPCLGDLSGTNDVLIVGHYDAQDRMTAYGTCSFGYTANGELTQRTDTATNATTTYRYDVFGNLREATLPNDTELAYDIDGQNRRIGKRVNGTRVQGFLYLNQLEPIAELDGSGNVVANFVYADRANTPSLMLKDGKIYRVIADHLGSVRLVIDIATGDVAQRMEYDEYGNVVEDTSPGFQPFGYAGGIYDRDTGLTRFGARDYDPISGRWTAKDPIKFRAGDTNIFAYAYSDPINRTDVSGLASYSNLPEITQHLAWLASIQGDNWHTNDVYMAERLMLARLASGRDTDQDIAFWHHETLEAQLCERVRTQYEQGEISADFAMQMQIAAHEETLRRQGNSSTDLYHWSAIVAAKLYTGVWLMPVP